MVKKKTSGKGKKSKKAKKRKAKDKREKEIAMLIVSFGLLIIAMIATYWIVEKNKRFEYAGLTWEKIRSGKVIFYKTNFTMIVNGRPKTIRLYLRSDPRKEIDVNASIRLKHLTYISTDPHIESCEKSIVALTELNLFLGVVGIKTKAAVPNWTESNRTGLPYLTCENKTDYSIIVIKPGEKNEIVQIKKDCYEIRYDNCEALHAIEQFIVEIIKQWRKGIGYCLPYCFPCYRYLSYEEECQLL